MIKMKIVLNELKTKKLGYEITNCYQVIDDFFLKNHLNKESKHIYTGDDNSFYLFAYLFNSLMKNTWFFRIIDEFKWYLCNVNDIKCIFYDLNGTAALKEISLKLELACNDYYDDKSFYDAYMEKCGFKTPVHNFLYHSNSAIEISKCITDLFSPNDFYLREQLKATIKRVIIIFAIDNGNNLLSLAYYISDKNLILPANRQDITKYIPTHNISKINFLTINQPIIFLDIDGVLQPDRYRNRFNKDRIALKNKLAQKFHDDKYLDFDEYDLAAVYYDWSKKAIDNLNKLIILNNAKIVLSSSWKNLISFKDLLRLFKIYQLDQYIIDIIPYACYTKLENIRRLTSLEKEQITDYFKLSKENSIKEREFQILKYVLDHKIKKYVALDDICFDNLKTTSVCTRNRDYFDDNCLILANDILNS